MMNKLVTPGISGCVRPVTRRRLSSGGRTLSSSMNSSSWLKMTLIILFDVGDVVDGKEEGFAFVIFDAEFDDIGGDGAEVIGPRRFQRHGRIAGGKVGDGDGQFGVPFEGGEIAWNGLKEDGEVVNLIRTRGEIPPVNGGVTGEQNGPAVGEVEVADLRG